MKALPWTFFILGMILFAAVWWDTDVEAGEAVYKRPLFEQTRWEMPTVHGPGSQGGAQQQRSLRTWAPVGHASLCPTYSGLSPTGS